MVGQKLEIKNSDPVLHNIKALPTKNRPFNISQPTEGMKTTRTFTRRKTVIPVECNVHGWMHCDVVVLPHPFFAVSGRRWQRSRSRAAGRDVQIEALA